MKTTVTETKNGALFVTLGWILGNLYIGLHKNHLVNSVLSELQGYKSMNISNSELDSVTLVSRIEDLKAEQNFHKKNIIWLKHYFDELKQQFNTRSELEQIQSMQQAIAQLSAQVAELQR